MRGLLDRLAASREERIEFLARLVEPRQRRTRRIALDSVSVLRLPRRERTRHTRSVTSGGWSISVKSISTATLMELYQLLKESGDKSRVVEIQGELVKRARAEGLTTQEIVRALVAGVGKKRERAAIAREWSEALRLTEKEARRLAG